LSIDAEDESNVDDDDDDEMGPSTKLVAPRSDLRSEAEAEAEVPLRLRLPNPVILVGCDGDDEEEDEEDEEDESGCRLFGAAVTGSIFAADEAVVVRPRRMIPVPVQNQNHAAPL
jgi:hypothetical protein